MVTVVEPDSEDMLEAAVDEINEADELFITEPPKNDEDARFTLRRRAVERAEEDYADAVVDTMKRSYGFFLE